MKKRTLLIMLACMLVLAMATSALASGEDAGTGLNKATPSELVKGEDGQHLTEGVTEDGAVESTPDGTLPEESGDPKTPAEDDHPEAGAAGTEDPGTVKPDTNLTVTRKLTAGLKSAGGGTNLLRGYNYPVGGNIFRSLSISASYNGSNIVISFSYDIFSPYNIWHINMGYGGELYGINVYSGGSSDWGSITSCSVGTVSYSSVSHASNSAKASGTITVTNPSGLKAWYESGNHAFWFDTYDPGSGPTVSITCSDQSPMNIPGLGTAIAYATCAHSYVCTAVDASTHRTACTKCGFVLGTGAHNTNVSDTSSSPGYTVRKCSACGYVSSTTANTYAVTLDNTGATTAGTTGVTATYGAAMPAITPPVKNGYEFMGYYRARDGAGTQYYDGVGASAHAYDIAGTATLYPYWVRNYEVTVTGTLENRFMVTGT